LGIAEKLAIGQTFEVKQRLHTASPTRVIVENELGEEIELVPQENEDSKNHSIRIVLKTLKTKFNKQ
jgi:hypothetical protein